MDDAEAGSLQPLLSRVGAALDQFLRFEHPDAVPSAPEWRPHLDAPLPVRGVGIDRVTEELVEYLIPNGSPIAKPGFSSFITTGGTTAATLASAAASIAAPQRYGLHAFNFLEELSLRWLGAMCGLDRMEGVYSPGGSVANLELVLEPTLSICCFRYTSPDVPDLDQLNQQLHRCLVRENRNLPSTTQVNGRLVLRPCFVGARYEIAHADDLIKDVLRIGAQLVAERTGIVNAG